MYGYFMPGALSNENILKIINVTIEYIRIIYSNFVGASSGFTGLKI